jgi:tRNA 2-thiouridine synthesizing protein A
VLKARRAMKDMAKGAVLEILADDPVAALDFAHFCETTGHVLLASDTRDGGDLHFLIRAEPAAAKAE